MSDSEPAPPANPQNRQATEIQQHDRLPPGFRLVRVGLVAGALALGLVIGSYYAAIVAFLDAHNAAVSAIAAVFVAIFTGTLYFATDKLWKTSERQAGIVGEQLAAMKRQSDQIERDFLAANRPQLVVRQIGFITDGDGQTIQYTLGNVGASRAEVIESNVTAWTYPKSTPWPAFPPYTPDTNAMGAITVEAGQEVIGIYQDAPHETRLLFGDVAKDRLDTMLLGYVLYVDRNGTRRRLGFCRKLDGEGLRFHPVDDPDYEFFY